MRGCLYSIPVCLLVLGCTPAIASEEPDPAPPKTNEVTGSIGFAIGVKVLDSGWEPLGDQTATLFSLTIGKTNWPVHIAVDYVGGEARNTRVTGFPLFPPFCCFSTQNLAESETTEWDVGIRRGWRPEKSFRPYLGGGVAFIDGELRVPAQSIFADGSTTGYWVDLGFRTGGRPWGEWGVDIRYSEGDVNLGTGEVDAGGPQGLLYFGGRF